MRHAYDGQPKRPVPRFGRATFPGAAANLGLEVTAAQRKVRTRLQLKLSEQISRIGRRKASPDPVGSGTSAPKISPRRAVPPHAKALMVVYYRRMRILQNIKPTAEQLVILRDTAPGFRLIRGAAGSGKTTAALMRLRQLCAARVTRNARMGFAGPVRVLVLTFNRTLRGYVEHLAAEQTTGAEEVDLTVDTFSRWAKNLCASPTNIVDQRQMIRQFLHNAGIAIDVEYFVDEIEYILGRFPRDGLEMYLQAERSGRGRAPTVSRRTRAKLLADVIAPYEQEKARRGEVDWNDIALEAAATTCEGYDVIVVDEAQDLSANQIRAVRAHLNEEHTTTFIIDAVQRIYPQAFQWREVGITIRPNLVYKLNRNHRNTAAIARFAASIVRDLPAEEDGVVPNPSESPSEGQRPEVLAGTYSAQINFMLNRVQPYLSAGETVAILQPRGGGWFDFVRGALSDRNLPFCELTRNRDWPTGPEQIALSTIHSAKGLEFDHVLLPGLNQEVTPHGTEEGDGTLDSLRRLVAMGIGRARKTVTIGYKPEDRSTLIDLIDPETYRLLEVG